MLVFAVSQASDLASDDFFWIVVFFCKKKTSVLLKKTVFIVFFKYGININTQVEKNASEGLMKHL